MILKGEITISRVSSNKEDDYVSISVIDAEASVEIVNVKLSLAEYANVLTNHAHRPCEVDWNDTGTVGKVREWKEVLVPYDIACFRDKGKAAAAFAPFSIDGWRGRESDYFNSHRDLLKDGKRYRRVIFERFVEREVAQ